MKRYLFLCLLLLSVSESARAAVYNLSLNQLPPCSTSWSVSGSTYSCTGNGRVTLNSGDQVLANSAAVISANNGFQFTDALVGSSSAPISLVATYGSIQLITSQLFGSITGSSSEITIDGGSVNGDLSTGGNVFLVTANIVGNVVSSNNRINASVSNITGNLRSQSGITLTGGSLTGDINLTSNNTLVLNGVNYISGNATGASTATIQNSTLGNSSRRVNITTNSGAITLSNTLAYGVFRAPDYSVINVQNGSQVYGQCLPSSQPANACQATPPTPPLLASDNFESYPLGSLNGADAGSGWGQSWQANNAQQQLIDVSSNRLSYLAPNGEFIAGGSRALQLKGNNSIVASRTFAHQHTDNVVYVSMLVRFQLSGGDNKFAAIWLEQTGFTSYPNIGIKTNRGTGSGPQDLFVRTNTGSDVYSTAIENGVTYLLVGRLSKSVAGASQPYNRFELWVNPITLSTQPATSDVISIGGSLATQVTQMGLRTENLAENDEVVIDQIAFGTTWQDVVQPSSEPTQCEIDSFSQSLSDRWVTARSSGNFTPQVIDGRLRMTQAVTNQATSVTYQRLFPARNNLVVVEFDYLAYGGNGADGMAVVLSDAAITPQPGAFGGPLGYGFKPGIPGFAGGWLGFGLDEFGNYSNEGGVTNIGRRRQAVVVRGSGSNNSGYRYLRGTCSNGTTNTNGACLSPTVDGNQNSPHRYRIVVDSRSGSSTLVSVARNTGSGFVTLIAPFDAQSQTGQAPVPENFFLSLTGSTGGSTNIHELDNVSICALRSSAVGQQIDHFEFDYSSTPLTCKAESFTVRACANASCSELVTTPVSATLAPATLANGGWVGGNVINFSGGSTQVVLQNRTASAVTVGVTSSVPATRPLSQTLCRRGSSALSTQNCSVTFAASGFVFEVPDDIAGRASTNIRLSAVKQDDLSQQCVPEFANVTRNVSFWSSYLNPVASGRPVSWPVQVNQNNVGLSQAQATSIPLNFNSQGQATISVNYQDAGEVELSARYVGSAANNDNGLVMAGADRFIRRPAGLCVRTSSSCVAGDATCPAFAVAGEPFPLTITAHSWGNGSSNYCENPVTPNFERTGIPLQFQLLAPAAGTPGSQGVAVYNHSRNAQAQTVVQQSVSETGVFRFGTTAFSYLGMADQVPLAWSNNTGRFVPDRFRLSDIALTQTPTCSVSTNLYMRQNLELRYRLTALNRQGSVTTNYHSGFVRATPVLGAASVSPAINFADRLHYQTNTANWVAGSALFGTASAAGESQLWLNRQSNGQPDGPYENTVLALQVLDGESPQRAIIENPDFNVLNPVCTGNQCNARRLTTFALRYGRMVLDNAFGPEFDDLPLVLRAEYWQQGQFVTNNFDQCSVVESTRLSRLNGDVEPAVGNANSVMINGISSPLALLLSAPNEVGRASYRYQAPPWLTFDWEQTGNYDQSPQNEVIFGRYRGNPRLIFWRER